MKMDRHVFNSSGLSSETNIMDTAIARSEMYMASRRPNTPDSTPRTRAAASNISAKGQIRNTLHMGFSSQDALNELLDNSIDAKAKKIRIQVGDILRISDDAPGMTPDNLVSATCFHNTRSASSENGRYGYGLKAAHIVLSNAEEQTFIFTRTTNDKDARETILDWPAYISEDVYNPKVSDLTRTRELEWEDHALDKTHGTVMVIPLKDRSAFEDITRLTEEIGRTYENVIRKGLIIEIVKDGVTHHPSFETALSYDDTPEAYRKEVPIEIWKRPGEKELRV